MEDMELICYMMTKLIIILDRTFYMKIPDKLCTVIPYQILERFLTSDHDLFCSVGL